MFYINFVQSIHEDVFCKKFHREFGLEVYCETDINHCGSPRNKLSSDDGMVFLIPKYTFKHGRIVSRGKAMFNPLNVRANTVDPTIIYEIVEKCILESYDWREQS